MCIEPPFDRKLFWWDHEFETVEKVSDDGYLEEQLIKEIVVNTGYQNQVQVVDFNHLELASGRAVLSFCE